MPFSCNILILGLDAAGKTTLLEKIKQLHGIPGLEWDKILPTVGLNVGRIEAHNCMMIFWLKAKGQKNTLILQVT